VHGREDENEHGLSSRSTRTRLGREWPGAGAECVLVLVAVLDRPCSSSYSRPCTYLERRAPPRPRPRLPTPTATREHGGALLIANATQANANGVAGGRMRSSGVLGCLRAARVVRQWQGMSLRLRVVLPVLGSALGWNASGCAAKTDPQPPAVCSAPQGSVAGAQSLASDDTAFALTFYAPAVAAGGSTGNVVLSPYSVSAAMTMVDVGAAGQTESQIESVLHLPANGAAVAPAYAALACGMEGDGSSNGNDLLIASSLWAQQGVSFEHTFESTLEDGYDAPLQQVDFEGDATGAVTSINGWVSGKTQGEIPSLLQPGDVDATTRLVLVNAIYFKGAWATGFDASQTGMQPFTLSDGTQVSVMTMTGSIDVRTGGSSELTVAELPYRGGALVMDFLMPTAPDGLSAFEATLTPATLNAALATLGRSISQPFYLPRFSFTTRLALIPVLSGMGMTDVFLPGQANLSGMDGATDLHVSAVVQEALVDVDEQGTAATAATAASVSVVKTDFTWPSPPLRIDQPFLFLVRDTQSGSILFMGHVTNPRA
jgi:serpin B